MFVGPLSPGADSEDSSAHRHFLNRNQTLESPKTSTRRHQTPDKGIGTLSGNCDTQDVFDDSHLSGKIKGSQTHVSEKCSIYN